MFLIRLKLFEIQPKDFHNCMNIYGRDPWYMGFSMKKEVRFDPSNIKFTYYLMKSCTRPKHFS